MFTSGVTSEGSAVLGLRKFGACPAVSVGKVEGGLVWRLVAKALVRGGSRKNERGGALGGVWQGCVL